MKIITSSSRTLQTLYFDITCGCFTHRALLGGMTLHFSGNVTIPSSWPIAPPPTWGFLFLHSCLTQQHFMPPAALMLLPLTGSLGPSSPFYLFPFSFFLQILAFVRLSPGFVFLQVPRPLLSWLNPPSFHVLPVPFSWSPTPICFGQGQQAQRGEGQLTSWRVTSAVIPFLHQSLMIKSTWQLQGQWNKTSVEFPDHWSCQMKDLRNKNKQKETKPRPKPKKPKTKQKHRKSKPAKIPALPS